MTIYDAAMAIVVVLGMVRGAWRGFTWQVASITSLILGYATAHSMSGQVASYLPGAPEVQRMLAMAVIYVAVSGGIFGIAWMIRGTLRKLKLEAYDRHLGTLLGGFEAVGVGMLATMFVVSVAPKTREPIFASPTGRVVGTVMNNLGPVLPVEIRKVLAPLWDGRSAADESVAEHDAGPSQPGVDGPAAATAGELAAAALPAPHEASSSGGPELPALPPLEAVPGEPIHHARPSADASVLPALDGPGGASPAQPATIGGALRQGRQEIEQAVAETLDASPNQKATNLRQLVNKDRQRIKGVVQDLKTSKQKLPSQVKDKVTKGQQQVEQAISDVISGSRQQVQKTINDTIDQQLERLGGLEAAPPKGQK